MDEKLLGAMENKSTYSEKLRKSSNEGYVLVFINPQYTGKELSKLLNEEIPPEKIRRTFTKLFHNTFRNTELVIKATESLPKAEELFSNPGSKFLFKDLATKAIGTVLEVLQNGLGLEISANVSADKDQIFVKVKATEDGLKVQADIIDYKLQFTADAAGLGDRTDLKDFQEVLPYAPFEKNSGKTPAPGFRKTVSNSENLYKRFNFQGIPTENGETLFRPADKIRLVRSMILSSVNLTRLTKKKILCSEFALPNEYDLFQLQQSWANFRLFYKFQPLHLVRNYFGEEITLYFSWLEFYLKWLFTPAIIGSILATTYYILRETNHEKEYSGACLIVFSFLIAISSSFIDQIWIRTEKTLAWKWGVTDYERIEEQRASFRGKSIKDEVSGKVKKVSHKTKFELFSRILGYIVMILFMAAVVSITYGITVFRNTSDFAWRDQVAGAINVVGIKTLNFIYPYVAKKITDMENIPLQTDFNNSLVLKLFWFQFVNSYFSLFYIAFLSSLSECKGHTCMEELQARMASMSVISLIFNLMELGIPLLINKYKIYKEEKRANENNKRLKRIEKEATKIPYDSPYKDYMEIIIGYGYTVMFGVAFPYTPVIAVIAVLLEIRVDAWKLCNITRRPFPAQDNSLHIWINIIQITSYFGAAFNIGIVIFTANFFSFDDLNSKWLCFLIIEHALFALKYIITTLIPDVPKRVENGVEWSERMVDEKLYEKYTDIDLEYLSKDLRFERKSMKNIITIEDLLEIK